MFFRREAVSPKGSQGAAMFPSVDKVGHSADCKSAIQQSETLRYEEARHIGIGAAESRSCLLSEFWVRLVRHLWHR